MATKNYYTISEFAKFRNININSLRYYEKLGFLTPAHIDPYTKYRYYTSQQLNELDHIMMCTDYGIPIRNLKNYLNSDGKLSERTLLEDSRKLALERIDAARRDLEKIDYMLRFIEESQQYADNRGMYTRHIRERLFATIDCTGCMHDPRKSEPLLHKLYDYCREYDLNPVLPAGFIFVYHKDGFTPRLYLECTGELPDDPNTVIIPADEYLCIQTSFGNGEIMEQIAEENFDTTENSMLIMTKLMLDKITIRGVRSEYQFLPDCADRIFR